MVKDKWECVNCGQTYRRRPGRCSGCGSTVFDPLDLPEVQSPSQSGVHVKRDATGDSRDDSRWVCERCGRVHDFRPSACVACGSTDLAYHGPPDEREDVDIPAGFPTSPKAIRREAAEAEIVDPINLRGVTLVVIVCTTFTILSIIYMFGLI